MLAIAAIPFWGFAEIVTCLKTRHPEGLIAPINSDWNPGISKHTPNPLGRFRAEVLAHPKLPKHERKTAKGRPFGRPFTIQDDAIYWLRFQLIKSPSVVDEDELLELD